MVFIIVFNIKKISKMKPANEIAGPSGHQYNYFIAFQLKIQGKAKLTLLLYLIMY